jgi:multidrug transporter EmrE-like cation transporter
MQNAKRLVAIFLTFAFITIAGVLLVFRPIAASDSPSDAWPAPLAVAVYAGLYVLLFEWAAKRLENSYAAAFVVAGSQAIFIVDLLARGERGHITAVAGLAIVAVSSVGVAFVHSRFSRRT